MTLRVEIFSSDLDATVDFYTRVLGFALASDERDRAGYVALERDDVRIGAALRPPGASSAAARRPPTGSELVLEVDDVAGERARVVNAGWPLDEDLTMRPWGLADFRVLDPCGYYLRVTHC